MANLAIKGHATRGNEVIKILEMLGGVNFNNHDGCRNMLYFISTNECEIMADFIANNPIYNIYTLETFLEKNPYKVGDKVMINADINDVYTIKSMTWNTDLERVVYRIEAIDGIEDNQFWFADEMVRYLEQEEETMDRKNNDNWAKWELPDGYEFQDTDGNIINTSVIRLVKKQPQYPKTYEECCEVLGYEPDRQTVTGYDAELIENLQTLKLCRDAYWKIAGEQMGLDKPLEPDWENCCATKYTISCVNNKIKLFKAHEYNYILAFSTEEMRNAFYENFKDLIEECKELL